MFTVIFVSWSIPIFNISNGHLTASAVFTSTDTVGSVSTLWSGHDIHTIRDSDGTAWAVLTTADTSSSCAACGRNRSFYDSDITTVDTITATNTRSFTIAAGIKWTRAFNGEGFTFRNINARIILIESLDKIGCAMSQNDGGIARTGNTRMVAVTTTSDIHTIKLHVGTIGDSDFIITA